jgi:hypothetical protein
MRWLSRWERGEQPTTAHVRRAVRRSRIVSSTVAPMAPRIAPVQPAALLRRPPGNVRRVAAEAT